MEKLYSLITAGMLENSIIFVSNLQSYHKVSSAEITKRDCMHAMQEHTEVHTLKQNILRVWLTA